MTEQKSKELKQQFETGKTYFNQCKIKESKKKKGRYMIQCEEKLSNVERVSAKDKD